MSSLARLPWANCAFLAIALSAPVEAQELDAGYEGSKLAGYGFVSPDFSIPLDTTNSVTIKPTFSYLYYETRDDSGTTRFTSPGTSIELGYKYETPKFTLEFGPALEALWQTTKSPDGTELRQTLVGLLVAGSMSYDITSLTVFSLLANYDENVRYFWSRAGIKRRITDLNFKGLSLGPELTGQGNKDIQQYSGGGLIDIGFDGGNTSVQIRGGYTWIEFANHSSDSRPYFGAGLYHQF